MNTAKNIVSIITHIGDDGHALFDRDTLESELTAEVLIDIADMALTNRREDAIGLQKGRFTKLISALRTNPEVAQEVAKLLAEHVESIK